jgi:hypothetical protein
MHFWPQGTIFVSVVDPGVGTTRKASVAKTADGYYVVSPDNGSLTHVKEWVGISEIREINQNVNRLRGKNTEGVAVFHGRDVFGYCAAKLASGIISYKEVGPAYDIHEIVTFPLTQPEYSQGRVNGIFEINDPNFGNLWTNIPLEIFNNAGFKYGDLVQVTIRHKDETILSEKVPFSQSFGFVKKGEMTIYTNELMRIGIALNQDNLCERYQLHFGHEWQVEFEK